MQHWILRCKHCQKEYTYCTYGNGPGYGTEEGCSQEYCAECQKAIDKALSKIPIKFKPQLVEIEDDELLSTLEKIKEKDNQKGCIKLTSITAGLYDIEDCYTHDWKEYWIKYNRETPEEKHLFVAMQYDIINKKLTNNYWKADKGGDSYMHGQSMTKSLLKASVSLSNMPPPLGLMFYNDDFTWEIKTKKNNNRYYAENKKFDS